MMETDIILKAITLLNRERELNIIPTEGSGDLVKSILEILSNKSNGKYFQGGDSETVSNLRHLLKDMVDNPANYDNSTLLNSLDLIIKDNPTLTKVTNNYINVDIGIPSLKRTTISLRNTLNNFYKLEKIKQNFSKANYKISTNNLGNDSVEEFISKFITNLEAYSNTTKVKDPGIVDEIDISSDEDMDNLLSKVKEQSDDGGRLKTGWKELNDMLGGGFRPGECVMLTALMHNYKSGTVQSIFAMLALYNKPKLKDETKKPLHLLISFEDDAEIIFNFLYRFLYYAENRKKPDLNTVTNTEIRNYIRTKLSATGYHVKILRVNPTEWTYKHLFNKILEYEASGYELHSTTVDYLHKLPTTGCITTGVIGSDIKDLYARCRNFFSSRRCLFITPHQSSSEAQQLLRNGVPAKDLVKETANKGYYESSKTLDQVPDLVIQQHIAKIKNQYYLTVQRGKRRFPEIIDDDKKYFMLPFPYQVPIPPNIDLDGNYIGNAAGTVENDTDDDFDI